MALADYTLFFKPKPESHVIISYHDQSRLAAMLATFFNEGLKLNQLCIFASVDLDNGILDEVSAIIKNYDEHIQNGNLLVVDLKPFRASVMNHDLSQFDDMKKSVLEQKSKRKDKHVRMFGDLASFLFEERNFEESLMLEKWCQSNPLGGTIVCPYKNEILSDPSYAKQKELILHDHDNLVLC